MQTELKRYSKNITKLLPKLIKTGVPDIIIEQKDEIKGFKEAKTTLREIYKAEIVIEDADTSKEAKANNALPGKPAILVE